MMSAVVLLVGCGSPSRVVALKVDGNLVRAGISRFVARGVVDYVLPFYTDGSSPDPELARFATSDRRNAQRQFAAMRHAGVNLVRIPIGLAGVQGEAYQLDQRAYLAALRSIVRQAEAAGLRVLISWWDSLGWGGLLTARYRQLWPMMHDVVAALGDDPAVIYEPFNEPNGITWGQWLQVMTATIEYWRTHLHYRGVLVLDTINYFWAFSPSDAQRVQALDTRLLAAPAQLIFANHQYPRSDQPCFCGEQRRTWDDTISRQLRVFPLMVTEVGIFNHDADANLAWMSGFASYLARFAIPSGLDGAVAFVWSWVDPNSLTDRSGVVLNAYGQIVHHELWTSS